MRCFAAWSLWFLGKADQAMTRIHEALTLASELSEPYGLAHALFFAATLHQLRREDHLAQDCAEAALSVSTEHGLTLYQAMATITRGWALFKQGRRDEGIEQMQQGFAAHQATGTEVLGPHFLALLAEALGENGQAAEGLRLLDKALAVSNRFGEKYYEAELYRIKGELLLMQQADRGLSRPATGGSVVFETEPPALAQAELCFNQSIKIAQQQKAMSWELRGAMSLVRLCQRQGKQQEARSLLAGIYARFSEGLDTVDLKEAKMLLAE